MFPPTHHKQKAFTLIEAVVAAVILSSAIIAYCAITTRSTNQVQLNRQREIAWQLLDRQLVTIAQAGIDEFIQQGKTEGLIEAHDIEFVWQAQLEPQDLGNLYALQLTLHWPHQGKNLKISTAALFNGNPTAGPPAGSPL